MTNRMWLVIALLFSAGCEKRGASLRVSPETEAKIAARVAAQRTAQAKAFREHAAAQARAAAETEKRFLNSPAGKIWKQHPTWDRDLCSMIARRKVQIGMTREQVRAAWGRPEDVNRTVFPNRVHEQWVYGSNYLYFMNDILESWQD